MIRRQMIPSGVVCAVDGMPGATVQHHHGHNAEIQVVGGDIITFLGGGVWTLHLDGKTSTHQGIEQARTVECAFEEACQQEAEFALITESCEGETACREHLADAIRKIHDEHGDGVHIAVWGAQ